MESRPKKARLDLGFFQVERRAMVRQLLFVVGTLDLAMVLLFTIMADWNEYPTAREWWDNMVLFLSTPLAGGSRRPCHLGSNFPFYFPRWMDFFRKSALFNPTPSVHAGYNCEG